MPNFSSSLFSIASYDQNNSTLDSVDTTFRSTDQSPGPPVHCSSPIKSKPDNATTVQKPMKTLNINFQSMKNKVKSICNLIQYTESNFVTGTETWLNSDISNSEIFPVNCDLIRRGRKDGYGGVMVAIRNDHIVEQLTINNNNEAVFSKIHVSKESGTIVGSIYRPQNSDFHYMDNLCSEIEHVVSMHKKRCYMDWRGLKSTRY